MNNRKRFLVVGGNPFTGYTRTMTYTSLRVVGCTDNQAEAERLRVDNYEACGGLIETFDLDNESANNIAAMLAPVVASENT